MESITNYNVMMVHGAYGPKNDDGELQGFDPGDYSQAIDTTNHLGAASMGSYTSNNRVTRWISHNILEEPKWEQDSSYVRHSYVYNWRAFSNTRNSSKNNAVELGDRTWNKDKTFGQRRALVEEAQEVKAVWYDSKKDTTYTGQVALEFIRKNPDLYRQLASRYILVGHSMGGVVSREYVQNSNYYHGDVDKIITLDSPHEGTGALNMQLDMVNVGRSAFEGLTTSLSVIAATATTLWIIGKDVPSLNIAGLGLAFSMEIAGLQLGIGEIIASNLEGYVETDSIVCYVDPNIEKSDFCNGDEPSINDLKSKMNDADSMPMLRMVAGENSMVFTDPKLGGRRALGLMIPDAITVPFANLTAQVSGGKGFITNFSNSMVGLAVGVLAGVNVQDHGSALVKTESGLALGTNMFMQSDVDVKRYRFNAAYEVSQSLLSDIVEVTLIMGTTAALAIDAIVLTAGVNQVAKIGVGAATALALAPAVGTAIAAGIIDLSKSHNYPIDANFKSWRVGGYNGYTDSVHVYEDFLYEKPFVNLLLGDAHTLEMIDNDTTHGKTATAKLNKSCFYIGSRDSAECVVGFFGDSVQNTSVSENVSVSKLEPLKFHSSQDWNEFGVKVDRWEKVPGLTSSGTQNDTLVPIRHVERYKLPKIVATDYIHRYSFVVDDLMPHRLREITMNFNFQTEIKWVCNVKIDPKLDTACTVYADKNDGNGLQQIGKVPHPVEKNGDFIFVPANLPDPAFKNPAYFQKDNQNTVTISTVNKIGLRKTQMFLRDITSGKSIFQWQMTPRPPLSPILCPFLLTVLRRRCPFPGKAAG